MRKLKGFTGLVVLSACLVSATSAGADVVSDWTAQILLYSNIGNAALVPPIPVGRPGPPGLLDIALAHVAIHDAVQAIEGEFQPYSYSDSSKLGVGSSAAAVAAAAHKMLVLLYSGQQSRLDAFYTAYLTSNGIDPLNPGIAVGEAAAEAIYKKHYRPTNTPFTPFFGNPVIGQWRSAQPMASQILTVTPPFTLNRASQFRPEPPPDDRRPRCMDRSADNPAGPFLGIDGERFVGLLEILETGLERLEFIEDAMLDPTRDA